MKDIESENYIVSFNQYTERHYIKDIEKKYKNAWFYYIYISSLIYDKTTN